MKKTGLKRNFFYSFSYQILALILPLITAPYVTRVLGAKNLGIYSESQALAHYFLLFAMLGVNNYGNRAIARVRDDKRERSRSFWEIYSLQFFTAIISFSLYWIYCFWIVRDNRTIYIMQSFYVMSGLLDVNWFCFGMEKFRLTSLRSMAVRILSAVSIFIFIDSSDDLWLYTFILSVSFILSSLVVWLFIWKYVDFICPTWNGIKRHIKPNLLLFWPVIAISLYNIMDKLMLGYFSEYEEVAFYTYAERIVTIPATVILALDNVIMPRMSNLYASNDRMQTKYLMDSVMLFAMFMTVAMGFGLAGVANVFAPWFYGNAFTRCGYFIVLLCPTIIFKGWAGALRTQYIIPMEKDMIYVSSLTVGAIANLVLNVLLIPRLSGIGAIIGTVVAEFIVFLIQFFMCRKDVDIKNYLLNGVSFCVIGFVMYQVVIALSDISGNVLITIIVQVICGVVIYVSLASVFMIKIRKNPILINEGLKMIRIKYQFK